MRTYPSPRCLLRIRAENPAEHESSCLGAEHESSDEAEQTVKSSHAY